MQIIFVLFGIFVFKKISCKKIRVICEIRVQKYSFNSFYYFPSVSGPTANLVFKKNLV